MYGYVVAQNGASGSGLVTTDSISGNLSLTYNGEMPITNILKTAQIQTWMTQ